MIKKFTPKFPNDKIALKNIKQKSHKNILVFLSSSKLDEPPKKSQFGGCLKFFHFYYSTSTNWKNSRISIIQAEKSHSGSYVCSVTNSTFATVNIQILMGK
jgi:hypothetical protein